jgi:hypothetical protein
MLSNRHTYVFDAEECSYLSYYGEREVEDEGHEETSAPEQTNVNESLKVNIEPTPAESLNHDQESFLEQVLSPLSDHFYSDLQLKRFSTFDALKKEHVHEPIKQQARKSSTSSSQLTLKHQPKSLDKSLRTISPPLSTGGPTYENSSRASMAMSEDLVPSYLASFVASERVQKIIEAAAAQQMEAQKIFQGLSSVHKERNRSGTRAPVFLPRGARIPRKAAVIPPAQLCDEYEVPNVEEAAVVVAEELSKSHASSDTYSMPSHVGIYLPSFEQLALGDRTDTSSVETVSWMPEAKDLRDEALSVNSFIYEPEASAVEPSFKESRLPAIETRNLNALQSPLSAMSISPHVSSSTVFSKPRTLQSDMLRMPTSPNSAYDFPSSEQEHVKLTPPAIFSASESDQEVKKRLQSLGIFDIEPTPSPNSARPASPHDVLSFSTPAHRRASKLSWVQDIGAPVLVSSSNGIKTIPIAVLLADLEKAKKLQSTEEKVRKSSFFGFKLNRT